LQRETARLRELTMQAVVPKLSETPGEARTLGPALGEHNAEVYGGVLGLDEGRIEALREAGVI